VKFIVIIKNITPIPNPLGLGSENNNQMATNLSMISILPPNNGNKKSNLNLKERIIMKR
jgi:hypothetical protein